MEAARFVKRFIYQTTRRRIPKCRSSCQPPIPSAFEIHQKNEVKTYNGRLLPIMRVMFLNATNLQAASRVHRDKSQAIGGSHTI